MSLRQATTTNDDQCQTTDPPPLPFATFDLSSPRFDPSFLPFFRTSDGLDQCHSFRQTEFFFTPPRDPLLYSRGEEQYGTS